MTTPIVSEEALVREMDADEVFEQWTLLYTGPLKQLCAKIFHQITGYSIWSHYWTNPANPIGTL